MSESRSTRFLSWMYRFRWPITGVMLMAMFGLMGAGMMRVMKFSKDVDSFKDPPPEKFQPKMFDARLDLWFDTADPALKTLYEIEETFIPEDTVLVAFEEREDPWGVFGEKSLATIARLTKAINQIANVRHVRSLTQTPWIRWGAVGGDEEGLLVGDLFENDPATYTREQRMERMIAVLGAQRAAKLAGEEEVRKALPPGAKFEDYIGEPRLMNGIISEDGRTAALQVQMLRPKIPPEKLEEAFGDDQPAREAAPNMYTSELQWVALSAIDAELDKEKGYDFHVTGMPPWERNFIDVGMKDMMWAGVMFVVLSIALFVVYRRWGAVLVPLLIVNATIMGMLGTMFLFGNLMNNLTSMLPQVMVSVGIAESVHLVTAYYLLRPSYTDKRELILAVVRKNAVAVLLTSITTAIAFFSQTTNTLLPVKMEGYWGGIGVIYAFFLTMVVIPTMLSLIPLKDKKPRPKAEQEIDLDDPSKPYWTDKFVRFAIRRRFAIIGATLAIVAVFGIGILRLDINADFRDWFPSDNRVVKDVYWLQDRLGGMGDLELIFSGPEPKKKDDDALRTREQRMEELQVKQLLNKQDPAAAAPTAEELAELEGLKKADEAYQHERIAVSEKFLASVDRFDQRMRKEMADPKSPLRYVTKLESGLDVLRKIHQVQNENKVSYYRIPTEADIPAEARTASIQYDDISEEAHLIPPQTASSLAAQYYIQYENGAKPVENLTTLISPDRRTFRIAARVFQIDATTQEKAFSRIREIVRTEFPELMGTPEDVETGKAVSSLNFTGRIYLFANMIDAMGPNLMISLLISILSITILIAIIYRSVWIALVAMGPNVLPIVIPLAAFGYFGIMLDAAALTIAAVALGVAIDDTIHILTKFDAARKEGLSVQDSLQRTFRELGAAVTNTTVILIVGFSVMLLSSFRVNILIGALATVMIGLAWVTDFILTPALLSFLRGRASKTPAKSP